MKKVIGIYSPAPQSGKTFASTVLTNKGYVRLSFAAPLKQMCIDFLLALGYSKNEAVRFVFTEKEKYIPEVAKTVRHMLRTLGTEWGRDCIDRDVWLTAFGKTAEKYDKIVVDDVRFLNEAMFLQSMGGEMWKIIRSSAINDTDHASEGALDSWEGFNRIIENDGTLEQFRKKIDALL